MMTRQVKSDWPLPVHLHVCFCVCVCVCVSPGAVAAIRPEGSGPGDGSWAPADLWQSAPPGGAPEEPHRQTQPALQLHVHWARQVSVCVCVCGCWRLFILWHIMTFPPLCMQGVRCSEHHHQPVCDQPAVALLSGLVQWSPLGHHQRSAAPRHHEDAALPHGSSRSFYSTAFVLTAPNSAYGTLKLLCSLFLRLRTSITWCGFSLICCPSCWSSSSSSFTGESHTRSQKQSRLAGRCTPSVDVAVTQAGSWIFVKQESHVVFSGRWRERGLAFCSGSKITLDNSTYSKFKTGELRWGSVTKGYLHANFFYGYLCTYHPWVVKNREDWKNQQLRFRDIVSCCVLSHDQLIQDATFASLLLEPGAWACIGWDWLNALWFVNEHSSKGSHFWLKPKSNTLKWLLFLLQRLRNKGFSQCWLKIMQCDGLHISRVLLYFHAVAFPSSVVFISVLTWLKSNNLLLFPPPITEMSDIWSVSSANSQAERTFNLATVTEHWPYANLATLSLILPTCQISPLYCVKCTLMK